MPDPHLIAYIADVGSQARDQLDLLASWSATERPTTAPATAAQPEESHTTPNRGTR